MYRSHRIGSGAYHWFTRCSRFCSTRSYWRSRSIWRPAWYLLRGRFVLVLVVVLVLGRAGGSKLPGYHHLVPPGQNPGNCPQNRLHIRVCPISPICPIGPVSSTRREFRHGGTFVHPPSFEDEDDDEY